MLARRPSFTRWAPPSSAGRWTSGRTSSSVRRPARTARRPYAAAFPSASPPSGPGSTAAITDSPGRPRPGAWLDRSPWTKTRETPPWATSAFFTLVILIPKVTFSLEDNEDTLKIWPFHFGFLYKITLSAESLHLDVEVTNKGREEEFDFTMALHSYYKVPDVTKVEVIT